MHITCQNGVLAPRGISPEHPARRTQGNQVLYQANSQSPIFPEIKSLMQRPWAFTMPFAPLWAPPESEIQVAFVYGSVAQQTERASSDIDLMVLGNVEFTEIVSAVSSVQKALAREINPTVFPVSEFQSKVKSGNYFLRNVMKAKKLFVLGSDRELAKLASK